ncbi:MAG: carboxylesterase/lipase family protein, partial [Pseudomonadales bacterium]
GQGAVPWYNGASFAKSDIVVVSINYRLGALGFTDLSRFGEDYATSGINGVLDQIAALEWVRDNIAGFGGDPQQVTIAGESAGGFSVATLLGSPRAQGLFQRAIPQSGAAHDTLTREVGARVADLLLEELQVDSMAALQAKSPLDILDAQNRADARYYKEGIGNGVMAFYPVEGDNEVLPEPLQTHLAAGVGADIPVLTGTNKDEATLFIMKKVSEESLLRQATGYGGGERLVNAYRQLYPDASTTDISIKLSTDFTFKIPALRLAELRASLGANTWLYQFDWESRAPHLKATHALEIPFTFNTLGSAGVDIFIGEGELPQALADEMHQVWTDFIRGDSPGWPAYELDKRAVKHFNTQSSLVEDGYADINAAWEGIR